MKIFLTTTMAFAIFLTIVNVQSAQADRGWRGHSRWILDMVSQQAMQDMDIKSAEVTQRIVIVGMIIGEIVSGIKLVS